MWLLIAQRAGRKINGVEQPKFDALTMGEFSLTIHYYTHPNKLLILYMRFTLVEGPPCDIRNKMYMYIIYIDHGLFSRHSVCHWCLILRQYSHLCLGQSKFSELQGNAPCWIHSYPTVPVSISLLEYSQPARLCIQSRKPENTFNSSTGTSDHGLHMCVDE